MNRSIRIRKNEFDFLNSIRKSYKLTWKQFFTKIFSNPIYISNKTKSLNHYGYIKIPDEIIEKAKWYKNQTNKTWGELLINCAINFKILKVGNMDFRNWLGKNYSIGLMNIKDINNMLQHTNKNKPTKSIEWNIAQITKNVISKNLKCSNCGKVFNKTGEMIYSYKTEQNKTIYVCLMCVKNYRRIE